MCAAVIAAAVTAAVVCGGQGGRIVVPGVELVDDDHVVVIGGEHGFCLVIDLLDGDEPEHGEHEHRQRLATDAHITLPRHVAVGRAADEQGAEEGGHRTDRQEDEEEAANRGHPTEARQAGDAGHVVGRLPTWRTCHQHKTRATMTTKEVAMVAHEVE